VQRGHQLLGAPERERRHQHPAPPRDGAFDDLGQRAFGAGLVGMHPVSVGALHDQHVDAGGMLGVAQDAPSRPAEVSAHAETQRAAAAPEFERGERRAEDVAGVEVLDPHALHQRPGRAIRVRHESLQRALDVHRTVERLAPRAGVVAIDVLHVLRHQMGAVREHHLAQVRGRGGGVNRAREPLRDQRRQVADVVEMRVRDHHRVERRRLFPERAVHPFRFVTPALVEAAIEQPARVAEAQPVAGTGDGAGGALEADGERDGHQ
jgi:hypothetical protein